MARKKKKKARPGGSRHGAGRKPMNPKDKMVSTSFALSRELLKLIDKQSHKEEMDRSKLIRVFAEEGLKRRGVSLGGGVKKKTPRAIKGVTTVRAASKPEESACLSIPSPQ